jgi:hypothetical protein
MTVVLKRECTVRVCAIANGKANFEMRPFVLPPHVSFVASAFSYSLSRLSTEKPSQ